MANFRSYSGQQIINKALRHISVLRTNQSNTEFSAELLPELNDLVDQWEIDRRKIWAARGDQYALTVGVQFYLIGPGAAPAVINDVQFGAIATVRPTEIVAANIVLNTTNPSVRQAVKVLNVDQWAAIKVQGIPFAIPLELWYDQNFSQTASLGVGIPAGLGAISLWPGPLSAYQLELFTPQSIANLLQFVDLNTAYAFPPGYAEAISFSFAEKIIPMMATYLKGDKQMLAEVKRQASKGRALIDNFNRRPVFMSCDEAFMGSDRGAFNYLTGE